MLSLLQRYEDYINDKKMKLIKVLLCHTWYLTEKMIPLSLCNSELSDEERESLATPYLSHQDQVEYLVVILGLDNIEWLQVPCSMWEKFESYRKLKEFSSNKLFRKLSNTMV